MGTSWPKRIAIGMLRVASLTGTKRFDGRMDSIVILAHGRYGDFILLTQLIGQLKAVRPDISITLVVFRRDAHLFFEHDPNLAALYFLKRGSGELFRLLFGNRFDLLYNPKDALSVDYIMLSVLLRARFKVAHLHDHHRGIYDGLIDMEPDLHATVRNAGIFDLLGISRSGMEAVRPYLPPHDVREEVMQFCSALSGRRCIGVNLSASVAERRWSTPRWKELMARFPDRSFIVFSAPGERSGKEELERSLPGVLPSPATANLGEVAALMRQLDLLVTPDTSLVHLAACYDIPVVVLYPDRHNSLRFAPLSTSSRGVIADDGNVNTITVAVMEDALRSFAGQLPKPVR